ncbi:RNA exonuclease ngl2 [Coemansia sp. RSA 552]|nr:RNA exonuclease ngl2 [Coemansia sp. RSA 552]
MRPVPESCKTRHWLSLDPQVAAPSPAPANSFTVMSYNVLCQKLIKRTLFPYANKSSLKWKTRRPLLLAELTHLRPDLVCLQEVYTKNWDDTFDMWFRREGYQAHLFQSVYKSHGVSIAWNKDRFAMVDQLGVNMDRSSPVEGELLETGNVALVVALQRTDVEGAPGVIVSNTHLFWKPSACYERLQQQILLMRAINMMKQKHPGYSVILCGDYNTTPDDAGYDLLTKPRPVALNEQQLDNLLPRSDDSDDDAESADESQANDAGPGTATHEESVASQRRRLEILAQQAEAQLRVDTQRVDRMVAALLRECPEPLASCYSTYADLDPSYHTDKWEGEPIYTNYTHWKGTLDYIFYSPDQGIRACQVLSLPEKAKLRPGLPNNTYASDHISLVARFELETPR